MRAVYVFSAKIKLMHRPKMLVRTLFVFILLAGLVAGIFLSSLASVRAAPQSQAANHVVISEFRPRGPGGATDEFVESFNPTGGPISIGGWMVRKSSGCGTTTQDLVTINSGIVLQPDQHYLVASNTFSKISADQTYNSSSVSIADNGGVAIIDSVKCNY